MKIDLNQVSTEEFYVDPHDIHGETCFLIRPKHIDCNWTHKNKHLRSSVWDSQGNLVSAGFPKFTNWGEKPENFPMPTSLHGCTVVEKLDGSLLCLSKFKDKHIFRTRGTVDAYKLNNGFELDVFKQIHSAVLNSYKDEPTWNHTYLFEWLSSTNKIILNYEDVPQFKLIGMVYHDDYSLASQATLNSVANKLRIQRPETFIFGSFEELLSQVADWKGREGVCIYSKGDQEIHKVKSSDYLIRHRFKENATLENTLDLFVSYGYPTYVEFEQKLIQQFDYECFEMVRDFASQVVDAFKEVREIEAGMVRFVEGLKDMNRKDAAQKIISSYGNAKQTSFCFQLFDGASFTDKEYIKLLRQILK